MIISYKSHEMSASNQDKSVFVEVYDEKHCVEMMKLLNVDRKKSKNYCDGTLQAERKEYPVHKCIVGLLSEFLKSMFDVEMREKYEKVIKINNMTDVVLGNILDFIYTGFVRMTSDNVFDLLEGAEYIQVDGLKSNCKNYLVKSTNAENCLKYRAFAQRYNLDEVCDASNQVIAEKFADVIQHEDFNELDSDAVSSLINARKERIHEEVVFSSIVRWVNHNADQRHEFFVKLFSFVDLGALSQTFLDNHVLSEPLILSSMQCLQHLLDPSGPLKLVAKSSAPSSSILGKLVSQKPAGSWSCTDCYSTNPPSTPKCLACNAVNPNASKQDTGSHPPAEAGNQPKPLFKFGTNISQESVPKFTFSFGVPQTQEPARRGINTAPQPSAQANPGFGKLVSQKPAGSWSCTDCYSTNPPSTPKCLACNAANPNAPKQDTASIPSVQPSNQPKPLFKFRTGISPAPSQASKFSFGVPETKPSSASESGVKLAQQAPSSFILGKLVSQKPAGSWSCTDCYSTNPPSTPKCLACNAANPNAPKQGTAPTSEPNSEAKDLTNDKPAETRVSGHVSSTQFSTANLFGTSSSSNSCDQIPVTAAAEIPKPRPTLDDERAEETNSIGDDGDNSSSCTTDDDEDYPADSDEEGKLHESLMTKFAAQKKNDDDQDVICFGEVLPSEKLQEKARQLQLPLHFYNFKETSDSSSDDDDDDGDDDGDSTPQTTSTVKSQPTSFDLNKYKEVGKREDPEKSAAESSVTSSGPFGSTMVGHRMSFADQAFGKAGYGFSFGGVKSSSAWKPDDKPMFSQQNEADDADQSKKQDKERNDLHFAPAINLPEIVPVVTGEEDEQTIYSHRAKLYRWDQGSAQWKERGVGDVCIKYNQSSHRYRIVMRREQVLKVCANHYLTADMKFTAHADSEKAWTWVAADFSEGGDNTTMEQFAIKFKNEEIAQEFKDKVEECQVLLSTDSNSTNNNNNAGTTSALISQVEKMKTELGFFKEKLLMAPKVDLENTFTGGLGKTGLEKIALTSLTEKQLREKTQGGSATGMLLPPTDEKKTSMPSAVEEYLSKSHLSLNKFEFKMKLQTGPPPPEQPETTRNVSICSERSEDSHADSIHFEPKIPLPDKIEVMTGEESERILFANRSKLYVFDRTGQEWKERGLGEMKVLQDQQTFQIRLVMRREQVLKVCLNHRVTNDIGFTYKDNSEQKVLLWTATDFSDPDKQDGKLLQFAIRFKTAKVASLFFETLTEAKQAASDSRLLDSFDVSQEQSSTTAPKDDLANRSPVKVPRKPAIYSFANVQSPFQKDFGKNYFTDFAKDQQQTKPEAPTQSEKFNFNLSSISFTLESTSTPVAAPVFGGRGAAETEKPAAIKSLFAAEKTMKPEAIADYETEKLNAVTMTGIEQFNVPASSKIPKCKPVLAQSPPLIEVKTVEEDEKVLFQERCKLYRFDHKTEMWKERGLGDLKILFHPELQSYRVVMRREQVLKVCANHPILPDMNLMSNTEKAWMYVAQDISEGEPEMEKFTVKFKTSDIAMIFKSVFETAQGKQ